jgi:hypothetical protein
MDQESDRSGRVENAVSATPDEGSTPAEHGQLVVEPLGPRPIFLFTMHRGGGTLLQRVVNASRDVLIWGEHGGFINKMAETDALLSHFDNVCRSIEDRHLADFISNRDPEVFDPWTNPLERSAYRTYAKDFIRTTFSTGLADNQRWGFKEVRYHSLRTARFLTDLFPWSRIVVLRRNLTAVVVSTVCAPWSLERLKHVGTIDVWDVIRDVAYAVAVFAYADDAIIRELPNHAISIAVENLKDEVARMFDFLQLRMPDVTDILYRRIGGTEEAARLGLFGSYELLEMAENAVASAVDQVRVNGANIEKIRQSRYGFLAGDNEVAWTGLSSTL